MTEERSPYSGREVTSYLEDDYRLRDADGDEIGKIVELNSDFVVVERGGGFLGIGDKDHIFVPRQEIAREDDSDWYLNIRGDELEGRGWDERPQAYDRQQGDESFNAAGENGDLGQRRSDTGTRITRYEEDLEASKVQRQAGEVTIGKRVVEDTKTIEVPVRREEIHVERHPVTADATTGVGSDEAFRDNERITVPLMEEDVEVRKVARPVEEVEITKSSHEETRHVDDTVRREEFDIDDTGSSRGHTREI
ncbi:MAG TPA: YsnF/AvaK domain-containing protein [Candidatus Limnocylindrales bacterium]|nr:YsnF/AvaK domain-containing protein [Candidatus Limnocylindrales bacterium]